jgi:hypothetical protein
MTRGVTWRGRIAELSCRAGVLSNRGRSLSLSKSQFSRQLVSRPTNSLLCGRWFFWGSGSRVPRKRKFDPNWTDTRFGSGNCLVYSVNIWTLDVCLPVTARSTTITVGVVYCFRSCSAGNYHRRHEHLSPLAHLRQLAASRLFDMVDGQRTTMYARSELSKDETLKSYRAN